MASAATPWPVLCLVLVAGCAVGPNFHSPAPLTANQAYTRADEVIPAQAAIGDKVALGWDADASIQVEDDVEHDHRCAVGQDRQRADRRRRIGKARGR